jgi:hypothetical protein
VALIWICFLVQALFYCVEQPIWEGLDEWAHFAYVQNICEQGRIPVPGDDTSIEVSRSLQDLPLPFQPGGRIRTELTHDQYWALSPEARAARETALRQMPAAAAWEIGGAGLYEAQQAPLYYVLMAPVYNAFRHTSLAARLLAIRIATVIIASLLIPLVYANSKELFGSNRIALLITCLAASLPGLLMDVSRAGNESLAVVLGAAMTLITLRMIRRGARMRDWLILGLILGAGLLTKAYFLAFLMTAPALALLLALRNHRLRNHRWKQEAKGAAVALVIAILLGGAWYARMERLTGSLSGEKNLAAIADQGFAAKIEAAAHVNWVRIVYDQVYSQIWLGGWSFLRGRPWMYAVFELLAILCVIGLGRYALNHRARRRFTRIDVALAMLAVTIILFEPGLFYQALAVYMMTHEAFGPGWYFYVVLVPELLLLMAGALALLGRHRAQTVAAAAALFALALNLYTMHLLLLPYYTGLIVHAANGSFHAAHLAVVLREIHLSQILRTPFVHAGVISPAFFTVFWIAYVCSAFCAAIIAFRISSISRNRVTSKAAFASAFKDV